MKISQVFNAYILVEQASSIALLHAKPGSTLLALCDYSASYGSTGCRVFKQGIQNWKDFCLKINIPKGNY